MSIESLSVIVTLYVIIRFLRIMFSKKEEYFIRALTIAFTVIVLFMLWNIVATNRFDFEDWVEFKPTMEPVTITEDLGLEETEGKILKK